MCKTLINSLKKISKTHIKSFKKVLTFLKPTLKDKNIEIRTIAKAANSLKKSLPEELGLAETSIETESDRSQTDLSIEQNSILCSPADLCAMDATQAITNSSLDEENQKNNSDLTARFKR